jgi:hypothetical protein
MGGAGTGRSTAEDWANQGQPATEATTVVEARRPEASSLMAERAAGIPARSCEVQQVGQRKLLGPAGACRCIGPPS